MKRFIIFVYAVVGVVFIGSSLLIKLNMPIMLPTVSGVSLVTDLNKVDSSSLSIEWPKNAQASVGVYGYGTQLISDPRQKSMPTASTAKLITALVVLDKKPLDLGESGPNIAISGRDVALYSQYVANNGTTTRVIAGGKISQYQMLQSMMLPSSNNAADSLAIWAFGSLADYKKAAQVFLEKYDLKHTMIGSDASGLDPGTTSTASDLAKIAKLALGNPVLRQIVMQKTANISMAGEIVNTNKLLGQDGFVGIKTGHTDEAGGVYVFASEHRFAELKSPVVIYGAVQGAPTITDALEDARILVRSIKKNLKIVNVVQPGQQILQLQTDWGGHYNVVAKDAIASVAFPGVSYVPRIELDMLVLPIRANSQVGRLVVGDKSTPLVVSQDIELPTAFERIFSH